MSSLVTSFGVAGFEVSRHERIAMLVEMVGGQGPAAKLAQVSHDTVNNWRKPGSRVPLEGMLALAVAAGVSLDWIATGHQVRPDMADATVAIVGTHLGNELADFTRLTMIGDEIIQPPAAADAVALTGIAVSRTWLKAAFDLSPDTARFAKVTDDGMAPRISVGSIAIVDMREQPLRSGFYLARLGEELLARRLYRMPDGNFELVADADGNWRYQLQPAALPELRPIVWAGQTI